MGVKEFAVELYVLAANLLGAVMHASPVPPGLRTTAEMWMLKAQKLCRELGCEVRFTPLQWEGVTPLSLGGAAQIATFVVRVDRALAKVNLHNDWRKDFPELFLYPLPDERDDLAWTLAYGHDFGVAVVERHAHLEVKFS